MLKQTKRALLIPFITIAIAVTGIIAVDTFAQKENSPRAVDKLAIGEDEVKQLLLLMDTNNNGKISKAEYMKFMEAEFERLDKDKSGELDPKELTQSSLRVSHFARAGK